MKAAIYKGAHDTVIEELDIPKVEDTDILIKVVKAGVCGTDIAGWKLGPEAAGLKVDMEWGHEFSGIVDKVGKKVKGIKPGDHVWVNPDLARTRSRISCCNTGAFSEYYLVENAELDFNVFELADNVTFEEAALIEPYCVGTGGKNAAQCKPGDKVLIYGDGTIGLCALSACVAAGIKDVVVIGMIEKRLNLALEMGATAVCNAGEQDVKEFLIDTWGGVPDPMYGNEYVNVDKWIDCLGMQLVMDNFMAMAKPMSTIAIVGLYKKPVELNFITLLAHELTIVGSCAYDNDDIHEVIKAVEDKRTPILKIATDVFPYDSFTDALDQSLNLEESIKVLIDYGVE